MKSIVCAPIDGYQGVAIRELVQENLDTYPEGRCSEGASYPF